MALYLGSKKVSMKSGSGGMKAFFDAGGKCAYSSATTFVGTIGYSDTSNVTSMANMFTQCSNLTTIPQLDTNKVTSMYRMFAGCDNFTTMPALDTSKVTNMSYMFYECYFLNNVPWLDTSKVTNMSYMFADCSSSIFFTQIPAFDVSNVTNMSYMFLRCQRLNEIHMTGMKVSFDISASTEFDESALVEILNNLATVTSTQTLTMGSTNLAKLTDDEKAIATNKGWTLK